MKSFCCLTALLLVALPLSANAQPGVTLPPAPVVDHGHHGWTLGFGVGGGLVANRFNSLGAATGHFFVGGWISPRTAITFDSFNHVLSNNSGSWIYSIYGVGVQHFVGPKFWLGGSVGAAGIINSDTSPDSHESKIPSCCDTVLGLTTRAGYNVSESGPNAFTISADLSAAAFDNANVFSLSINVGYQVL